MRSTKLTSSDVPWKLLAVEAVLIVLSVLLALGVDSWRESREQQVLAGRALTGFIDEARYNCSRIRAVSGYHSAVLDGERQPRGLQVGLLRNDAWDVVKSTGAAGWLDYELVAIMSRIAARQRDHRDVVRAYLQAAFPLFLRDAIDDPANLHPTGERFVISELVRIQSDLVDAYDELEATAETHAAEPAVGAICPVD